VINLPNLSVFPEEDIADLIILAYDWLGLANKDSRFIFRDKEIYPALKLKDLGITD